jgi:hypothetical protein
MGRVCSIRGINKKCIYRFYLENLKVRDYSEDTSTHGTTVLIKMKIKQLFVSIWNGLIIFEVKTNRGFV